MVMKITFCVYFRSANSTKDRLIQMEAIKSDFAKLYFFRIIKKGTVT